MKKVELLAPSGDFECFMAAINAGADAVYLGGNKFGARAYANNFSEEEIIEALKIAHLFSRKVYLTVNTLVKECEINDLIPFMKPLVDAGLDGVIVQDIGVFFTLRENFPALELHASTQMTITGIYGAKYLKEIGATRIVPARELSLSEIKNIKEETGLEVETFIHGAMCYAYSGQCLFSSILGGRSGNRGRCAGPCRLPYIVNNKSTYPLSLKDMYTLNMIPELIDAGIDSFKIEGRMKSPEYVAGVTAMYRKYIDSYLQNPDKKFQVSKEDENLLKNLYIRSDLCEGYYKQHNNKTMVTIHEPGYKGCDSLVLEKIKQDYIDTKKCLLIKGKAKIIAGEESYLELTCNDLSVSCHGDMVSNALNRPLLKEDIFDKLSKTGGTCFKFESLEIETDNQSFMPVKALNELRRVAINKLEESILSRNNKSNIDYKPFMASPVKKNTLNEIYTSIKTVEQLKEVIKHDFVSGIYINSDLLLNENSLNQVLNIISENDKEYFLSLPAILREKSYKYLDKLLTLLKEDLFTGVLVKNMEEYIWLRDNNINLQMISDYSVYNWNKKAMEINDTLFTRTTIPVELNRKEICDVCNDNNELVVYSRLPLMYSANCVRNTFEGCMNKKGTEPNIYYITDRHNNQIPVEQNCYHCFNVLYNPVVMSLHNQLDSLKKIKIGVYRLEFTLEDCEEVNTILNYYEDLLHNSVKGDFPVKDYTAGHFKRGVE